MRAFRIGRGGELTPLAATAHSAGNGRFAIAARLPPGVDGDILVVTGESGSAEHRMALVQAWAAVDGVLVVAPVSVETTVEADVYLRAARTDPDAHLLRISRLRALISDRVADAIRASDRYGSDIDAAGHAVVAAVKAWRSALLDPALGLDPGRVDSALDAIGWAQAALDAQLYVATTNAEMNRARASYASAVKETFAAAKIGPELLASAAGAAAAAVRESSAALSPNARARLISEAESLRAKHVIEAIDSYLASKGAPLHDRIRIRVAGEQLLTRLIDAGDAAGEAEATVDDAWRLYQLNVKSKIDRKTPTRTAAMTSSLDAPELFSALMEAP